MKRAARQSIATPALCILGTDTGIGKTFVTCMLARRLRERGLRVGVCKPFASGGKPSRNGVLCDDTLRLRAAARTDATPAQITPVALRAPLAPNWAARLEHKTVNLRAAAKAVRDMAARHDVLLIEGVGGALVPLTDQITFADFLADFDVPAWIVARRGLGTLNHTLLTIEALRARKIPIAGVLLNAGSRRRGDPSERSNAANLRAVTDIHSIFELPYRPAPRIARRVADGILRSAGIPTRLKAK